MERILLSVSLNNIMFFLCISCFLLIDFQTLDLLCHITNAGNVETVCDKLLSYLKSTTDAYFRTQLVDRITELAERYPLIVQLLSVAWTKICVDFICLYIYMSTGSLRLGTKERRTNEQVNERINQPRSEQASERTNEKESVRTNQ